MHNSKLRFNLFQIEQEGFENHKNLRSKKDFRTEKEIKDEKRNSDRKRQRKVVANPNEKCCFYFAHHVQKMKKTRKTVSGVEVRKSLLLHASREKAF
jgi:hypothetical protein